LLQAFGLTQGGSSKQVIIEWLIPGFKKFAVQAFPDATLKLVDAFVSDEAGFVAGAVGVKALAAQIETNLFPNPSSNGTFTLSFDKPSAKNWTLKIYDLSGREIAAETISGEGKITHNFQVGTEKGIYFYALLNENQVFMNNGACVVD
jgi:hypothetical protein